MPLIYLVRHGETAWNREHRWQGQRDIPLTVLGEAQARAAGRRLAHMDPPPAALYASPLIRAWQTAVLIGTACGPEPLPRPGGAGGGGGLRGGRPRRGPRPARPRGLRALAERRHRLDRRRDLRRHV